LRLHVGLFECVRELVAAGGLSSPTSDSVTGNYVALVRSFWCDILAADEVSLGNIAARTCLGKTGNHGRHHELSEDSHASDHAAGLAC
jgi:hypothetical protein